MAEEFRNTLTGEMPRPGYALDDGGAGAAGGDVQVFRLALEGPLPSLEADDHHRAIISHLPRDAEVSNGVRTPDQSWSVGVTQLASLTISVPTSSLATDDPGGFLGDVTVTIQDETNGGHVAQVTASLVAQDRGYPYKSHLAGGIIAWKAAGLPTKS